MESAQYQISQENITDGVNYFDLVSPSFQDPNKIFMGLSSLVFTSDHTTEFIMDVDVNNLNTMTQSQKNIVELTLDVVYTFALVCPSTGDINYDHSSELCVANCPDNTYFDHICRSCHVTCAKCHGPNQDDCDDCYPSMNR